jgi:hypothetical protein
VKLMEEERQQRERLRQEDKKEFQDALEQFSLKLAKIFEVKIENLNEKLTERLETEIIKVSEELASLKEETEQKIQVVNGKFNSLRSGVNESLKVQMSTIKQNNEVLSQTLVEHRSNTADSMGEIRQEISTLKQERLSNKLNNHNKEVESKFENIQAEIVNLRHGVIVDKFCELEKKLETKIKELVDSRLAKVESQLDKFCGQGTAIHSANLQSSADGVRGTNGNHVGAIPTSDPPAMSQFLSNRRHDNSNNDDCLHVRAQTEANRGVSELSHVNDLVPGFGHFHGSVTSDLALPKFNNCKKQNTVNFLEELDSYFQLKDVHAEIKLPIAMKAITDEYTKQWVTAIYKELINYEYFKQAITGLLWSPQIQSQVHCSI